MRHIYFISAFLYLSTISLAQEYNFSNNEYHLTYRDFVNQYGIDDTSRAIIDVFFDKREDSGSGQMSFLPLSTAIVAINPPIGLGLMAISTPLFVSGLITYKKYSRKNLLKTLVNYQENAVLSKRFKKRVIQLIQTQGEIYAEDALEAQYNLTK